MTLHLKFGPRLPRHGYFLWVIGLVCFALVTTVRAQGNPNINYGQTLSGKITDDAFRAVYTFQGSRGEIVNIQVQRTQGNLDPLVVLMDAQNTIVARSDSTGLNAILTLNNITLPQSGVYYLVVTRFGQDRGMTTGSYSLTLQRVGIATDPRIEAGGAIPIKYGDNVVREVGDQAYEQLYTFGALRGDLVTIKLQRISGDLDPLLILADSQGKVLLISDDDPASPGTLDAAITNYRIQDSGNYLVLATRFGRESGTSRGSYSLTIKLPAPEDMGSTPENAILLDYGLTVSGTINTDTLQRYYLIQVEPGDVITIDVTRTKGNLDPDVRLYSADMSRVVAQDTGNNGRNAHIDALRIRAAGTYMIVVSRFGDEKGASQGDYALKVEARRAGQ